MPTYDRLRRFDRDYAVLDRRQRDAFRAALNRFVADLDARRPFRPGLRVRSVEGARGIFEMTWARGGRATFHFGRSVHAGERHVVWRRIGSHAIFDDP